MLELVKCEARAANFVYINTNVKFIYCHFKSMRKGCMMRLFNVEQLHCVLLEYILIFVPFVID